MSHLSFLGGSIYHCVSSSGRISGWATDNLKSSTKEGNIHITREISYYYHKYTYYQGDRTPAWADGAGSGAASGGQRPPTATSAGHVTGVPAPRNGRFEGFRSLGLWE